MAKGIQGIQATRGIIGRAGIIGVDLPPQWKKKAPLAPSGESFDMVSAGTYHSFGLLDGVLYAWGDNSKGQLGIGTVSSYEEEPVAVDITTSLAGKKVVGISTGDYHSLAICSDGTVHAWGQNDYKQLGDGTTTQRTSPVAVDITTSLAGKNVIGISAGYSHSLAFCSDGTAHGWGLNSSGQLGDGTTTSRTSPVAVSTTTSLAGKTVIGISAGLKHSVALCSNGTAHAWGYGGWGQLGDGNHTSSLSPVAVSTTTSLAGKTVIGISAGLNHSLAFCLDGTAHGWGENGLGQLGLGFTDYFSASPVTVKTTTSLAGKNVIGISAGDRHSFFFCEDGTAHACGYNYKGVLGDGTTTQRTSPVAVDITTSLAGKKVIGISSFGFHAIAFCSDGTAHGWGLNSSGQLGDGTKINSSTPVETDFSGVI